MSTWEIIGTVLGVIGVVLMVRQNVWGWPVGIVQVAVYGWVFYDAKLYSDAILQGFFFVLQIYGWWHWAHGDERTQAKLPVTRLRGREAVAWSVVGLAATMAWGEFMGRTTDAALPRWDAFILMFSLIAQWLQARKELECWAGWMIVNIVAISVYWVKDLRLTAGLYAVFFGLAVAGHFAWKRSIPEPERSWRW